MARVLMVIAPVNFRDEEFEHPYRILSGRGHEVIVASTRRGTAIGMLGKRVEVQTTIEEVKPEDFEAVVVVGGTGSQRYLWDHSPLHSIVRHLYERGKVVAAICISPVVLARAGIVKGKRVTVFPYQPAVNALKQAGAIVEKQPVVVDGNLITARDPKAARAFGEAIAQALS